MEQVNMFFNSNITLFSQGQLWFCAHGHHPTCRGAPVRGLKEKHLLCQVLDHLLPLQLAFLPNGANIPEIQTVVEMFTIVVEAHMIYV